MEAISGAEKQAKKMITDYRLSFFGLFLCLRIGLHFWPDNFSTNDCFSIAWRMSWKELC